MSVLETLQIYAAATFYGILVILYIIKQCITKGIRHVFYWKRWDRPKILDDPSFGVHGFFTLKDGVRIHYVASGPEDKPLMLFLHGFPEFWYSWRYQIREFQKDYRVVAIDQRGYNESSKPQGIDNYSVSKRIEDVEQIIPALGYKSCVLVGHDWGGIVGFAFGRFHPDLVDKLIIMNCPPTLILTEHMQTCRKQQKMLWYCFFFQLLWLPELLFKIEDFSAFEYLFTSQRRPITSMDKDEYINPYKYVFSQPGALTPAINYYRAWLGRSLKISKPYDLEYTMPVLLLWGCQDIAIDEAITDIIEKAAPKIELQRIPDASHFVQMDAPNEVNNIMREWLKKN